MNQSVLQTLQSSIAFSRRSKQVNFRPEGSDKQSKISEALISSRTSLEHCFNAKFPTDHSRSVISEARIDVNVQHMCS